MDPEIEEIIKRQMKKLPIEVRKLFVNLELSNRVENIGKKNGLNPEQIETLQTEVTLVMLGLVLPDDFPNELENNLKIDVVKLDNIVNDVRQQLFRDVKEKLEEAYGKIEDDLEGAENIYENANWQQNLNFILSGGDYSAFIEIPPLLDKEGAGGGNSKTPSQISPLAGGEVLNHHLAFGTPPQKGGEGNKTNIPISPKRITDLRSKFTI
jgi:hypothetical protein